MHNVERVDRETHSSQHQNQSSSNEIDWQKIYDGENEILLHAALKLSVVRRTGLSTATYHDMCCLQVQWQDLSSSSSSGETLVVQKYFSSHYGKTEMLDQMGLWPYKAGHFLPSCDFGAPESQCSASEFLLSTQKRGREKGNQSCLISLVLGGCRVKSLFPPHPPSSRKKQGQGRRCQSHHHDQADSLSEKNEQCS